MTVINNNILVNSELEQLANINLLSIRIKWLEKSNTKWSSSVLNGIEKYVVENKGSIIELSCIEDYEFLSDSQRLKILNENKEMYLYEVATKELENSYSEDLSLSEDEFEYDNVIQSHFKILNNLKSIIPKVTELLKKNSELIQFWSISVNEHALSHPGNLYIKGIPKDMTIDDLLPVFMNFGNVISLKIKTDQLGKSLGYGFLSFQLGSQASLCKNELNGTNLNGSSLFINYHVERKERERIYWDNLRENNFNDKNFKGIFIGNLPLYDDKKNLVTPDQVFEKFCSSLSDVLPLDSIVSYYFPKENSNSNVEYNEDDHTINSNGNDSEEDLNGINDQKINVETCPEQNEEYPLKGYGFIKFKNHEYALAAIKHFNDFEWFNNQIIVNKAVQNRPHHSASTSSNVNEFYYNDISNSPSSNSISSLNNANNNNSNGNNIALHYYHPYGMQFNNPLPSYYNYNPTTKPNLFHRNFSTNPYVGYFAHSSSHSFDSSESKNAMFSTSPTTTSQNSTPPSTNGNKIGSNDNIEEYLESGQNVSTNHNATNDSNHTFNYYNNNYSPYFKQNGIKPMQNLNGRFIYPRPLRDQQESNIYIKHLPLSWKDADLYDFYKIFGEVISAKIITVGGSKNRTLKNEIDDSDTPVGSSKGYGFVYFKNSIDASKAIIETNRHKIDKDHILHVSFAQKRARSVDEVSMNNNGSINTNNKIRYQEFINSGSHGHRASYGDYSNMKHSNSRYLNNDMSRSRHSISNYQIGIPGYIPPINHWNFHMVSSSTYGGIPTPNFIPPMSVPYIIHAPALANKVVIEDSNYESDN